MPSNLATERESNWMPECEGVDLGADLFILPNLSRHGNAGNQLIMPSILAAERESNWMPECEGVDLGADLFILPSLSRHGNAGNENEDGFRVMLDKGPQPAGGCRFEPLFDNQSENHAQPNATQEMDGDEDFVPVLGPATVIENSQGREEEIDEDFIVIPKDDTEERSVESIDGEYVLLPTQ
ncbi:hypothetical protein EST38_g4655 [Candolleomyces aberdarensis]|uniref:Uncharacterized protein n=1 Tax=Candolleomyces aberdarensis TaxID=2316362 RepID=A0A4Q2DPC6_9AGAR|nr:hypothetical protein EST38_g4655 [Candolleomyces aberdarensis]